MDWTEQLRDVAKYAAKFSPDPSSQNAGILSNGDRFYMMTLAVNQFPQNVHDLPERWEGPTKYQYVEHAERNAIYYAAQYGIATRGLTLVCLWAACPDCARAIIQANLARLVTLRPTEEGSHAGWDDGIKVAMGMLAEAGVKVEYIDGPLGVTIRRNGKDFSC